VPEFLSEATAIEDYANPRRPHVVGTSNYPRRWQKAYDFALAGVISLLPGSSKHNEVHTRETAGNWVDKIKFVPSRQAELLKLATNSYYSLKVIFANMLYDIGMTQETLDALAADPWIVPSHFTVMHRGYRGIGGACLPKDTQALKDYAGTEWLASLLSTVNTYNTELREPEAEHAITNNA
jgi:UDP-glucose 6-dehydrogenase